MTEQSQGSHKYRPIMCGVFAEILFAALPLIVVFVVLIHIGHSKKIFLSPEWSFGASILFGQSLIKFVLGISRVGSTATGPVALACALIIVLGLVPSLIVLTLTLIVQESEQNAAFWLEYAQVGSFALAAVTYAIFGFAGEVWHGHYSARDENNQPHSGD